MKKLVAISIMAAMLLAIGVAAMATETQWQLLMRASDASGNGYGSNFTAGTKATTLDTKDTSDVAGGFTATGVANVMSYNAAYGGSPALYSSDYRTKITGTETQTWDLCLWRMQAVPASFTTLKLTWWAGASAPSNNDPVGSFGGVPYSYAIEVINDPTGQNSGFKWSSDDPTGGSATAGLGSISWSALTDTQAKGDQFYAVDNAIKLRLTVAPKGAPLVTPEPSSMLALASGLFGMAGFAIRRRK